MRQKPFATGNSYGTGRPRGARNRLATSVLKDVLEFWNEPAAASDPGRGINEPGGMTDQTDSLFIAAGMHYYVAGRYAVFAGLNPTAANLLHHAVEMALKGALAKKGMDLKALRNLNHDLPKIWRAFTAQYGIDDSAFDNVIAELQKFENIRYPDKIVSQGLASMITPGKPTAPTGHMRHVLGLGEIDELMDKIFTAGSISHKSFAAYANMPMAKEYLIKENEVAAWK
jgi:hypothetical protein